MIQFYAISTISMEPTLPVNSTIGVTKLRTPKRNSVIAFKVKPLFNTDMFDQPKKDEISYVSRIIGFEGDEVEIKDGDIYINSEKQNHPFITYFTYILQYKEYEKHKDNYGFRLTMDQGLEGAEKHIFLTKPEIQELQDEIEIKSFDYPIKSNDLYQFSNIIEDDWTMNNFGPIRVPEDH